MNNDQVKVTIELADGRVPCAGETFDALILLGGRHEAGDDEPDFVMAALNLSPDHIVTFFALAAIQLHEQGHCPPPAQMLLSAMVRTRTLDVGERRTVLDERVPDPEELN